ncbi:MAG: hypothetical protein AAF228_11785 [Pseudomonadota bacterium]
MAEHKLHPESASDNTETEQKLGEPTILKIQDYYGDEKTVWFVTYEGYDRGFELDASLTKDEVRQRAEGFREYINNGGCK